MNMVVQTPAVPKAPLWLSRFWAPGVMTLVGIRLWLLPDLQLSVSDWILRGIYVAIVPMSWWQAIRRPKPPSAPVELHESN